VEILTAIKDFKKGIYEAQWQVAKLGMDSVVSFCFQMWTQNFILSLSP
jgi:hypothetical protein